MSIRLIQFMSGLGQDWSIQVTDQRFSLGLILKASDN